MTHQIRTQYVSPLMVLTRMRLMPSNGANLILGGLFEKWSVCNDKFVMATAFPDLIDAFHAERIPDMSHGPLQCKFANLPCLNIILPN